MFDLFDTEEARAKFARDLAKIAKLVFKVAESNNIGAIAVLALTQLDVWVTVQEQLKKRPDCPYPPSEPETEETKH
jgi:hypothetical protein